jgi:hypothetical protein
MTRSVRFFFGSCFLCPNLFFFCLLFFPSLEQSSLLLGFPFTLSRLYHPSVNCLSLPSNDRDRLKPSSTPAAAPLVWQKNDESSLCTSTSLGICIHQPCFGLFPLPLLHLHLHLLSPPSRLTTDSPAFLPPPFRWLHRTIFQMRLDRTRNAEMARRNQSQQMQMQQRLRDPTFFPQAPRGGF